MESNRHTNKPHEAVQAQERTEEAASRKPVRNCWHARIKKKKKKKRKKKKKCETNSEVRKLIASWITVHPGNIFGRGCMKLSCTDWMHGLGWEGGAREWIQMKSLGFVGWIGVQSCPLGWAVSQSEEPGIHWQWQDLWRQGAGNLACSS